MEQLRLYVRADDAGMCVSVNEAVRLAAEAGLLRNISLMAPAPDIEDAAKRLSNLRGMAFGLHLTLNCEWQDVRWGPVARPWDVPSLVLLDGTFRRTPADLNAAGYTADDVIREAEAQLDRLQTLGFELTYIDDHMGVSWLPGVREMLIQFAERHGLVPWLDVRGTSIDAAAGCDEIGSNGLREAWWIMHPGLDGELLRRFETVEHPGQSVAAARQRDYEALIDPDRIRRWRDVSSMPRRRARSQVLLQPLPAGPTRSATIGERKACDLGD